MAPSGARRLALARANRGGRNGANRIGREGRAMHLQLDGLEKHLRLIDSYKKLHAARAATAAAASKSHP